MDLYEIYEFFKYFNVLEIAIGLAFLVELFCFINKGADDDIFDKILRKVKKTGAKLLIVCATCILGCAML